MSVLRKYWPLLVSLAVLLGLIVAELGYMMATQHHVEYALDDPYIHMAVAKHFVENGVWGMTPYEFSSSSSSLLWTLLLAGLRFVHANDRLIPLALNVLFGCVGVIVFDGILRFHKVKPLKRAATLLGLVILTPMVPVIFTGMEHMLQILLTVGFLYLASRALSEDTLVSWGGGPGRIKRWMLLLSPLLTGIRYEGMFPLALVCSAFLLKRRWFYAMALGSLGLAPLVVLGLYSRAHGWFFFPNTLLLKARPPTDPIALLKYLIGFLGNGQYVGLPAIVRYPYVLSFFLVLVLGFVVLWRHGNRLRDQRQVFLLLTLGTLVLHMQFARIGWFYRYEAYLFAASTLAAVLALHDRFDVWLTPGASPRTWIRPGVALLLLGAPLGHGLLGLARTPQSARRIYEYEIQAAHFFHAYYERESVVIGEIGAINYYADLRALDFEGLGSIETARTLLSHGRMPPDELAQLARTRNATIALGHERVWDTWGCLPKDWILVGEWDAHDPTQPDWTYRFYAVNPGEVERLRHNLQDFSGRLLPWIETRLYPPLVVRDG